ncbi:MAG TPA: hypothetical protein VEW48_01250 [Thermoanaerobaculia bacterium]|nr:hypothetical protein [Thermoanaerobaculia bacterium]
MKAFSLPAKMTLAILILIAGGALAGWKATASFRPTSDGGPIFAVINADRSAGAVATSITVTSGSVRKSFARGNQYANCGGPMSGWVLMVRTSGSDLFTLTTTGKIVRPPYQGMAPPEVGHPCYKVDIVRFR